MDLLIFAKKNFDYEVNRELHEKYEFGTIFSCLYNKTGIKTIIPMINFAKRFSSFPIRN